MTVHRVAIFSATEDERRTVGDVLVAAGYAPMDRKRTLAGCVGYERKGREMILALTGINNHSSKDAATDLLIKEPTVKLALLARRYGSCCLGPSGA